MVYRIFIEKKQGADSFAANLKRELNSALELNITKLRDIVCYDLEGISEAQFENAVTAALSDPAVDEAYTELNIKGKVFAFAAVKGQYDQRARQTQEFLQFLYKTPSLPLVRPSRFIIVDGVTDSELSEIKEYLINPLENTEIALDKPSTLAFSAATPPDVETINGFCKMNSAQLNDIIKSHGLAMKSEDILFIQDYFKTEHRDPTVTEVKVLDTYWSDHCRHSTFFTELTDIKIDSDNPHIKNALDEYRQLFKKHYKNRPDKYECLMDIATIGAREIKARGLLGDLDESEEVNACSIKVTANVNGQPENWTVMFKNETHNHPTEIEPFGGASTALGGGIRDPLSGRVWVYQAMGITGASPDVIKPVREKLSGKLSQRFLSRTAADGFSSYANQIGTNSGLLCEIFHEGYAAKRLECGFIIGAAPSENIVRSSPIAGDVVIYVGADTGRDGVGGASGSSREQTENALDTLSAEVQKGNPVIERKYMRLFRNPEATALIKKCNDFGAGGVSVAIGELADGLDINLDLVPTKYEGLNGTELALSESQERMACVVAAKDAEKFISLAHQENVQALVVAQVTDSNRMIIKWRGKTIVDLSREFLNTSGVRQKAAAKIIEKRTAFFDNVSAESKPHLDKNDYKSAALTELSRLAVTSQKGIVEMFDGTVGASNVYHILGGKTQLTPAISMASHLPIKSGKTDTTTVASYAFNPTLSESDAFTGAVYSVLVSVVKLVASGVRGANVRLTLQEYFKSLAGDPERWGQPLAALLGALTAQNALNTPAIGGKDSMSGSWKNIDVPPTVLSFAVGVTSDKNLITNVLDKSHKNLYELSLERDEYGMPNFEKIVKAFEIVHQNILSKNIRFAQVVDEGGVAAAVIKSALGNEVGVKFASPNKDLFLPRLGNLILEVVDIKPLKELDLTLVASVGDDTICFGEQAITMDEAKIAFTKTLENVFPTAMPALPISAHNVSFEVRSENKAKTSVAKPRVLIPVFNGTNGEYDLAKKFLNSGAEVQEVLIKNLTIADMEESIKQLAKEIKTSQIIAFPSGFSFPNQPDGNGKFGVAAFAVPAVIEALFDLINRRDGLILGVQSGFSTIMKLGLLNPLPMARVGKGFPSLTENAIGRYACGLTDVRIASVKSPWLAGCKVGEVYKVPYSFAEGRFVAGKTELDALIKNGQIALQYANGLDATTEYPQNPSGSVMAVAGLNSINGRVLGTMCGIDRMGEGLYKNVAGEQYPDIFASGVKYFK